jgi:hypothetical protein
MNPENVIKVVSQVAGIGGLAIVLFLLVARAALKTLPPPKNVPSNHFFRTIDRLILYTFILSVIGIAVYALLGLTNHAIRISSTLSSVERQNDELNEKLSKMKQDYDGLSAKMSLIQDINLKLRSAAIEVFSADITFDFRNWVELKPEEWGTAKRSSEVTTTRRRIWRAFPETKKFFATYSTKSPFKPDFYCESHDITIVPNTDRLQSGKPSEDRWILEYDISNIRNAPLRQPFDVVTRIEAWNARQNQKEEDEGTLIMFPTHIASLTVLFPPHKRPTAVECVYYPLENNHSAIPFENPDLTIAPDRSWVRWEIKQPRLGYHYVIRWKW